MRIAERRLQNTDAGRRPSSSSASLPSSRRRTDRAITLIELLLVMAIMTLIVSAIAVAAFSVQRRAQVRATKALLGKLALGLDLYRNTYRMYVPQDFTVNDSVEDELRHSTLPLWVALELEGGLLEVEAEYKAEGGTITDPTTGSKAKWYFYQDAWRKPLKYECRPPYKKYTLISGGPDLDISTGGDNIVRE